MTRRNAPDPATWREAVYVSQFAICLYYRESAWEQICDEEELLEWLRRARRANSEGRTSEVEQLLRVVSNSLLATLLRRKDRQTGPLPRLRAEKTILFALGVVVTHFPFKLFRAESTTPHSACDIVAESVHGMMREGNNGIIGGKIQGELLPAAGSYKAVERIARKRHEPELVNDWRFGRVRRRLPVCSHCFWAESKGLRLPR